MNWKQYRVERARGEGKEPNNPSWFPLKRRKGQESIDSLERANPHWRARTFNRIKTLKPRRKCPHHHQMKTSIQRYERTKHREMNRLVERGKLWRPKPYRWMRHETKPRGTSGIKSLREWETLRVKGIGEANRYKKRSLILISPKGTESHGRRRKPLASTSSTRTPYGIDSTTEVREPFHRLATAVTLWSRAKGWGRRVPVASSALLFSRKTS